MIDGTDLFKIGNLVVGAKAVVTCLYSSLERERETVARVQGFIRVKTTALLRRTNRKNKVFKILSLEPIREQWNLTVSQLGTVRIFKGGDGFELCEF